MSLSDALLRGANPRKLSYLSRRAASRASAGPPPGSYDPTIDANIRAGKRNYNDLSGDFGVGQTRAQDDLAYALSQLGQSKSETLADATTGHNRTLADIATSRDRAGADYGTSLANLALNYQRLGRKQGEAARVAHVESSGILAQSAAARAANQARDKAPIDLSYSRFSQDSAQSQDRANQDYATNTGRVGTHAADQAGRLNLDFSRLWDPQAGDNVLKVQRAGRDLASGTLDATKLKWYQATANGYSPPKSKSTRRRPLIV